MTIRLSANLLEKSYIDHYVLHLNSSCVFTHGYLLENLFIAAYKISFKF